MSEYDKIAQLYNVAVEKKIGQSNFSDLTAPQIYNYYSGLNVERENHRALDLGCGTGQQSIFLAKKGMHVDAVDVSQGMLDIAKKNAERAGFQDYIDFYRQDIVSEDSFARVGLIVATFNVINHLNQEGMIKKLFEKAFAALTHGGLFAFDIATAENMMGWNSVDVKEIECDFDDVDGATVISRKSHCPEKQRNLTEITCFFKEKNRTSYRRSNCRIYSYIYGLDKLSVLLAEVGFSDIKFVDLNLNSVSNPEELDVALLLARKYKKDN